MNVLLYARVSTARQAERELSLPAQIHLMERYARDRGWTIAGVYQDVASGTSLRERPGLLTALREATKKKSIEGLVVHKLDRLSRNTFNYLILKGRLRSAGVRIYSVVESIEDNPMGEFMEHIMAAQAEYYSANLGTEVKKGLHERLRRGHWASMTPLGYRMERGRVVLDPARAQFIRQLFERWSSGTATSQELADEIHGQGLVGLHGRKLEGKHLCRLLHNPFYAGRMVAGGETYVGAHQPLVSAELFDRAQEVFRQKRGGGRRVRRHLSFLLTGKVVCPRCGQFLIGEEHRKPSGKVYRYYRCRLTGCYYTRAEPLESAVVEAILALHLPEKLIPALRRRVRAARHEGQRQRGEQVHALRAERRRLEDDLHALARRYGQNELDTDTFDQERENLRNAARATEWLVANIAETDAGGEDEKLLDLLSSLPERLRSDDLVLRSEALDRMVERLRIDPAGPVVVVRRTMDFSTAT